MTTGILPITNIIRVTVQGTPSGIDEKNVNSLALFTTETPVSSLNDYEIALSQQQVVELYGTSSTTAAMATAIFSQSPNILTGNGRLVIIPLQSAVSATSGDFETASLASNIASIIAVTDGDLKVTIDGTDYDLTGLDFSSASDIDGIATILQKRLTEGIVTATSTQITITSKKVGASADVAVAQLSGGSGTDLSGAGYFNTAGGTATSGADGSGETIAEAITRTEGQVGYVGVITNLEMNDTVFEALSDTIQAKDMILLHHFSSTADIAGIATTVQQATNTQTRCLLYTESPAEANLMKAAYAGRAFSVNFSGSNTSQTLNLKSLSTITPDSGVSQTNYVNADTAGIDLYVSYEGVQSIYSTGGNLYFDQVYSRLALKFALEAAGFNFLRQTNTKVPQTEAGMDGLKNAYAQVFERFVRAQYIGTGLAWNGSTFGDPEALIRNVEEKGYYIYSLPIAQQAQSERENRQAPLVQCAIKEAGAIHTSNVIVNVEA